MRELTASTLPEFIEATAAIRSEWSPTPREPLDIWYRGQRRADLQLLPALYCPQLKAQQYDEGRLFNRFTALASAFLPRIPTDDWEWCFLAQHYGLPTRLLDWTESPLAAAYFALYETAMEMGKAAIVDQLSKGHQSPVFDQASPVVWIIDAGSLNRISLGPKGDVVIVPGGPISRHYLPSSVSGAKRPRKYWHEKRRLSNSRPIALLPPRSDPRIVAQQGTFTIHGWERIPIEELPYHPKKGLMVARIILDRANLPSMWDQLESSGLSCLSLFPELPSVAPYLRWVCSLE